MRTLKQNTNYCYYVTIKPVQCAKQCTYMHRIEAHNIKFCSNSEYIEEKCSCEGKSTPTKKDSLAGFQTWGLFLM